MAQGNPGDVNSGGGGGGGYIIAPGTPWLTRGGRGGPGIVVIAYPAD